MKRILTIVLTVCAIMLAADVQGQPLLKTHVETGDVEGILDGSLAVYKAIPYAAPPVGSLRWKARSLHCPGRASGNATPSGPYPLSPHVPGALPT